MLQFPCQFPRDAETRFLKKDFPRPWPGAHDTRELWLAWARVYYTRSNKLAANFLWLEQIVTSFRAMGQCPVGKWQAKSLQSMEDIRMSGGLSFLGNSRKGCFLLRTQNRTNCKTHIRLLYPVLKRDLFPPWNHWKGNDRKSLQVKGEKWTNSIAGDLQSKTKMPMIFYLNKEVNRARRW